MTIRILQNQSTPEGIKDIIYDDHMEIGYCIKTIHNNDHLWITHIEILPQYRGQGFGRQTIQEYRNIARNQNCNLIRCEPIGESVGFWSAVGFNNVGSETRGYPPQESDPIYERSV